jgi:hypothetical protein
MLEQCQNDSDVGSQLSSFSWEDPGVDNLRQFFKIEG